VGNRLVKDMRQTGRAITAASTNNPTNYSWTRIARLRIRKGFRMLNGISLSEIARMRGSNPQRSINYQK
jgi:hypothetical protein